MSGKVNARDWYAAIRDADTYCVKLFRERGLTSLQRTKLGILVRAYLLEWAGRRIAETDGVSAKDAKRILADVKTLVMEDAVSGIWTEEESAELTVFLYECLQDDLDWEDYAALLVKVTGCDDDGEAADPLLSAAADYMYIFARERKQICNPVRPRNEDDPPPWLDEFEYIDWIMTHH